MRLGSLCTGIAGLDLGLQMAGVDTDPVFVSDIDKGANDWLAANMPDVPNVGDFTALGELPEVDIITAGFPCQPVSQAGKRQGVHDERWIFDDITRLTSRMGTRPLLFLENVPGLLTANSGDAMARVVHGLADIGYHITWGTLPASAVGAPHRRNRWWGLAWHASDFNQEWSFGDSGSIRRSQASTRGSDSDAADTERVRVGRSPGPDETGGTSFGVVGRSSTIADADADGARRENQRVAFESEPEHDRVGGGQLLAPDAEGAEWRGPQQQAVDATVGPAAEPRERHRPDAERFGKWAPAVARWEIILGRPAPDPTDDGRLNPAFVEWMMGYPEGWVCGTLTNRREALHALGNAVVPQCVAAAFTQLTNRNSHQGEHHE